MVDFLTLVVIEPKFVVGPAVTGGTSSGTTKGGVTYNGPTLFKHNNKNWSKYMNKNNVSPFLGIPFNEDNDLINATEHILGLMFLSQKMGDMNSVSSRMIGQNCLLMALYQRI